MTVLSSCLTENAISAQATTMPPTRDPLEIVRFLQAHAENPTGLPPVHLWQPDCCGEMDLRIARDGQWYHEGTPFTRHALVKLFASILRRDEDEQYYLVTPVEKVRIQVEDAPFVATAVAITEVAGQAALQFTTNTGDTIVAGPEHPLWVNTDATSGEPSPYIHIRARLHALIARNVFYELVAQAKEQEIDGETVLTVQSLGHRYTLGILC